VYLTSAFNPVKKIDGDVFNSLYNVTFAVQATNYKNNTYRGVKKSLFLLFIIVEVRPYVQGVAPDL